MPDDWFDAGGSGSRIQAQDLLTASVLDRIAELLDLGVLVSAGLSRDGGALGVTVTFDGRWRRDWFREPNELEAWLEGAGTATSAALEVLASSGPGRRSRGTRARSNGS